LLASAIFLAALLEAVYAKGIYPHAPLHDWFESLHSGRGLCCAFTDGIPIEDWGMESIPADMAKSLRDIGQPVPSQVYWVKIPTREGYNGYRGPMVCFDDDMEVCKIEKIPVPPNAVVTAPNKFGKAVVWPYYDVNDHLQIRCFMPGTLV
jgi:hypothetical protein